MSEREQIISGVKTLARRRRLQMLFEGLLRGLFWGSIPAAAIIFSARLFILPASEYLLAGSALAVVTLYVVVRTALKRLSALSVANDLDVRLGLRERVSTGLALSTEENLKRSPVVRAVLKDAAANVKPEKLKQVYPWALPPVWKRTLAGLAAVIALCFLPQLNWFVKGSARAEAKVVQTEAKKLKQLAKETEKEAEKQADPVLKQQAREVMRVGKKLDTPKATKKEALKELKRLDEKLKEQQKNLAGGSRNEVAEKLNDNLAELKSTNQIAKDLKARQSDSEMKNLQGALDELLKNLGEGKLTPEQQKMMQDLLKAVEKTLESEESKDPANSEMTKQLEDLAKALQNEEKLREMLQELMESLSKELAELAEQLQKAGMKSESSKLSEQMKQLMEQFEKSGSMDQQDLEDFVKQLEQTDESIKQNEQLSEQEQKDLQEAMKEVMEHFQKSQPGGKQNMQQANQQCKNCRIGVGDKLGQQGEGGKGQGQQKGSGQGKGEGAQAAALRAQIASMRQGLAGQYAQAQQGQASSSWGSGTSPYAVSPAPAKTANQVEDRTDGIDRDGETTDFDPLYAPTDADGKFQDVRPNANFDMNAPPQKIEEFHSLPEDQKALREYQDVIATYAQDEEGAIDREQVPPEYQELVKKYFDEIAKDKSGKKPKSEDDADSGR